MTFLVTNLACFLLKISSAPNFRPSFHYFNWKTAAFGAIISGASMFFVDGVYATGCVALLIAIFLIIHYTTPPKSCKYSCCLGSGGVFTNIDSGGDVSQTLIYHQVRKYLLRLRQEHVKFWRPQVLLLINDPRRQYKLIQFCNSLKKGALFILGHVIVSDDFGETIPEARKQQASWMKYIDLSRVKAFVDVSIAPTLEWGTRNLLMNTGLGGMRPNIVIMGFYNLELFRASQPLVDISTDTATSVDIPRRGSDMERSRMSFPTDTNRQERDITPSAYVTILEDLLLRLKINFAIARGFSGLELPDLSKGLGKKKYIDLWPIQMSAQISTEHVEKQNITTTNFDTYTLILQLGCILNTVPKWKKAYELRIAVFVEYESDVEDERSRLNALLVNLRIKAKVLIFWLASGELNTYEVVVNGQPEESRYETEKYVDNILKDEDWWHEIQILRGRRVKSTTSEQLATLNEESSDELTMAAGLRSRSSRVDILPNIRRFVRSLSRRRSAGSISGPRLTMTTQRLDDDILNHHPIYNSASESSDSDDEDDNTYEDCMEDLEGPQTLSKSQRDHLEDSSRGRRFESLWFRHHSDESTPKVRPADVDSDDREMGRGARKATLSLIEPTKMSNAPGIPTTPGSAALKTPMSINSTLSAESRPRPSRRSSAAKFSSHVVPETTVSTDDGPGPSIMFAEPAESSPRKRSIYDRGASSATGFPNAQSVDLSFNDLPARAQHLILNDLIRQQSDETAVVFTTLPCPDEGTCRSEEDSLGYLTDVEVLCEGLPPVLLVHSNNLTVTVNL